MSLSIFSSDDSSPDQARYQAALDRYLQRFDRVEQGSDFFHNFDRCRDDGEKRRVFFETARRSDVPLRAIGELLTYKDQLLVTLALQSLSSIENEEIRVRLRTLELIEGIDAEPTEIYALVDPNKYQTWAQQVFYKLCEQAESGSDLDRLSAAWTIVQLNYSQVYTVKHLHQAAQKTYDEVRNQILNRLQDRLLNSSYSEREKLVECLTFAPVPVLMTFFALGRPPLLEDILPRLGILGIEFVVSGISSLDTYIIETALRLAQDIAQDSRYRDAGTQALLAQILVPVFEDQRQTLRELAANALIPLIPNLDQAKDKAQVLVILERWNEVARLGDVAIPDLHKAINGQATMKGPNNVESQLQAVKCLHQVCNDNEFKLMGNLGMVLLNHSDRVRHCAATLLAPIQHKLDSDQSRLVDVFKFELPYLNKELTQMTEQDFQERIAACQLVQDAYPALCSSAIFYLQQNLKDAIPLIKESREMRLEAASQLMYELTSNFQILRQAIDIIKSNISSIDYVKRTICTGVNLGICRSISSEAYKSYEMSLRDYEKNLKTTWETRSLETTSRFMQELTNACSSIQCSIKGIKSDFSKEASKAEDFIGFLVLGVPASLIPLFIAFIVVVKFLVLVAELEISAAINVFLLMVLIAVGIVMFFTFKNFSYRKKLDNSLKMLGNAANHLNDNWKDNTALKMN